MTLAMKLLESAAAVLEARGRGGCDERGAEHGNNAKMAFQSSQWGGYS